MASATLGADRLVPADVMHDFSMNVLGPKTSCGYKLEVSMYQRRAAKRAETGEIFRKSMEIEKDLQWVLPFRRSGLDNILSPHVTGTLKA